jgi:phospho-N-acetylmuramoyl-pentapeptide-transferase
MQTFSIVFACVAIAVLIVTAISEHFLIKLFRSHKVGQKILDIGPNWHKAKEGTPFMGGLGFILSALLVMTAFFIVKAVQGISSDYIPLALTLAFAVGNGAMAVEVGFVEFSRLGKEMFFHINTSSCR